MKKIYLIFCLFLLSSLSFVTLAQTISNVTSASADAKYKIGDVIPISVTFSAAVTVTGTPILTLETGTTDRDAIYSTGSGTTTLIFNYTVQAGDHTLDLDFIANGLTKPGGATIKDNATGLVDATLIPLTPGAAGSLGANKAIEIDGVVPTISNVTGSNNTYKILDNVDITINFSESVNITGFPTITLETGTTDRVATYISGTGSSAIVFRYQVQAGDESSDLNYKSITALSGIIKDLAGNDADFTLPGLYSSGSLGYLRDIVVDGVLPTVTNITSSKANGYYKQGDVIIVSVSFSEPVTGTPVLALTGVTLGTSVVYSSTSGNTLNFTYTVGASDGDGVAELDATTLTGTIADIAGNSVVNPTLPVTVNPNSLISNKNIVIDTDVPTISTVTSTTPANYIVDQPVNFSVLFSELVIVTGNPQILLETGTVDRYATYTSGSGTNTLVFTYTVQTGDANGDLTFGGTPGLELNGGTINDRAQNSASLAAFPTPAVFAGANAIVVDGVAPTITSVTGPSGTYSTGTVVITVNVNEAVTVAGGTPRILLETGTVDKYANYNAGTSTATALKFDYVLGAGDISSDLNYVSTTSLELNGATIKDNGGTGNAANLTLPNLNSLNSLAGSSTVVIDVVAPTVTSISSTTPNGYYNAGDVIIISVVFSEAVNVLGAPTLALNTGTTVNYSSGTGTNTLLFNYTITTGNTADLDYAATTSLTAGISIKDAAGNDADRTLFSPGAANSLGSNKNIAVDTQVPSISSVNSTTGNATYIVGQTILVDVNFSEIIVVTGSPRILLETGTIDRYATYSSGTGTTKLTFSYTVMSGDISSDLDYASASALELNGGTIADRAGNDLVLLNSLAIPGAVNSLGANKAIVVDGVVPTITKVEYGGAAHALPFKALETITIKVTFNEDVVVVGTPRILLETGATDQYANFVSEAAGVLLFDYIVQVGDESIDLNYRAINSLSLNGATIKDINLNNASLSLPALTSTNSLAGSSAIVVDGIAPTVTNVSSTTANGYYKSTGVIDIYVAFSEGVVVTTGATLTLNSGGTATYTATGSTSTLLHFVYTVGGTDNSADLDYSLTTSLLTAGSIQDAALNDANRTLPVPGATGSLGKNSAIVVDNTPATVTSGINGVNATTDGTKLFGQTILVTIGFSEPVIVTGTPQLQLETGTTDNFANYYAGSGSNKLIFKYIVQAGDASTDLDYTATTALGLNGGTINDRAGIPATRTLATPGNAGPPNTTGAAGSLSANKAIVVDGSVPTVTIVQKGGAAHLAPFVAAEVVTITATFSELVNVVGVPQIQLETGTTDRYALYSGGSGTTILSFTYTVQSGDVSTDLNYRGTTSLALNGGTIKDANGNNANLALPALTSLSSLGGSSAIAIDAKLPTVVSVNSSTANGYYNTPDAISISVTFSEAVTVSVAPALALNSGGSASYTSGSGSNVLIFTYTVAGGNSADLDYSATNSLTGTLVDAANNTAILTLPTPGTTGSLGRNKAIVIDNLPATIPADANGVNSTSDGLKILGQSIFITVGFTEPVFVTGYPRLKLETGTTDHYATYYTGSGRSLLTFKYTVQAGDINNVDLDYTATNALELNSGTITDRAGNIATLTLASPGAPGSLGNNRALLIDGVVPTVSLVEATIDQTYKPGDNVLINVTFADAVNVVGTPRILLETGTADRYATYTTNLGAGVLQFTYSVQAGDVTNDLNYKSTSSLYLNSGTIKDVSGNNVILTLPALNSLSSLAGSSAAVISSAPTVKFVTSTTGNGTYNTGDIVYVSVVFSKAVIVTGTPQLALNSGGTANYTSGTGGTTLIFKYTVATGNSSADLDYTSTSALTLAGGTIGDGVNVATLTLPTPGESGSLSRYKAIVIDGTPKKSNLYTISNTSNLLLNVYPIPSNGNFTVEYAGFNTSEVNVSVFDLLGRNVYSAKSSSVKESVSVSLNPGTYVLVVNNDTQKTTKRIVIE